MYYLIDFIQWKYFHVMQREIFPTITFCIAVQELEIWVHMCCSKFEEGDSQAQLYRSFWSSQESELCQEEGFQFSKVRISTKLTHPTCKTWILFTILLPAESYYKQLLSHSKSCLFKKNILWLTSVCSTLKPLFFWVAKCTSWAFAFFYQICRVILFNWCEIVINMKIYWRKTSLHYHYLIFSLLRVRCLLLISWLCLEVELWLLEL